MSSYSREYDDSSSGQPQQRRGQGMSAFKVRLIIALVIVGFSVVSYFANTAENPITGEKQRVALSEEQEIELGLQAAPEMAQQHHGLSRDLRATKSVKEMGARLLNTLYNRLEKEGRRMPYSFEFHLLADPEVVNAFALPGGQVFITEALYNKFTHAGQLAGVLGHEIGHVLERHGAEHMSHGQLMVSIANATGAATGDINAARMAQMVTSVISMKYGRNDELESDRWGIELMTLTGYHPAHMLEVMDILAESTGGAAPPEILSTHPRPENRKEYINQVIADRFPYGIPEGLE